MKSCAVLFPSVKEGFEGGAILNDVPVARQSRDRPRRGARRESNPTASAKNSMY